MAKANHILGVVTNALFRPSDIPYRSLRTVEDKILKACFLDGYKTMDLTRKRDGDQKASPTVACTFHVPPMYFACILCTGQDAKSCTFFKIDYNSL